MKISSLFLAIIVAGGMVSGCKTSENIAPESDLAANAKAGKENIDAFDQSANREIFHPSPGIQPGFCRNTTKFSIVNAYWLAVVASDVYGTKLTLEDLRRDIEMRFPKVNGQAEVIKKLEFFDSATPSPEAIAMNGGKPIGDWDTQAMWVETSNIIIIAFRGTQPKVLTDFATDGMLIKTRFAKSQDPIVDYGNVHAGFKWALDSLWPQIQSRLLENKNSNAQVFLTGHSLGAALATLAAARILTGHTFDNPDMSTSVRKRLRGLYTYGSPRVGDNQFVNATLVARAAVNGTVIARFRNRNDAVTRVPIINYYHAEPAYYMDQGTDGRARLYTNNGDDDVTAMRCNDDWWSGIATTNFSHSDSKSLFQDKTTSISDHGTKYYLQKLEQFYKRAQDMTKEAREPKDICQVKPWAGEISQTYCLPLK